MEHFAEMIVKYGIPVVISVVFIAGAVDLYRELKKNWVPRFLNSFENLSENVKGLNESLHMLTEQTPVIQEIKADVKSLIEMQRAA